MDLRGVNVVLSVLAGFLLLFAIAPYIRERAGLAYADVGELSPVCTNPDGVGISPEICCRALLNQLTCVRGEGLTCYIREGSAYELNFDQYEYCQRSGYAVPDIE